MDTQRDDVLSDPEAFLRGSAGPVPYPPGFYGSIWHRAPVFLGIGIGSIVLVLVPFPRGQVIEVSVALALIAMLSLLGLFLPWRSLPSWTWPLVPVGYMGAIAMLRDAQGGTWSGVGFLLLLPLVWLAFYGRRSHVYVGLVAFLAALLVPVVWVGPPNYPTDMDVRVVLIGTAVVALSTLTFADLVDRDRRYACTQAARAVTTQEADRQLLAAREELLHERDRLLAAEQELSTGLAEQNERLRRLARIREELVATVTHELHTPLTSIRGFVELLLEDLQSRLPAEDLQMLRAVERSAVQLQEITEDLLAEHRSVLAVGTGYERCDLAALAAAAVEAMQGMALRNQVAVTVSCEGPAEIFGNPLRLRQQLIVNLLSNALKYTPPGGRVAVSVARIGHLARLEVRDSGAGIAPGDRATLFQAYRRLPDAEAEGIPGTGLGLAIVHSVVESHDGHVEIVDVPGWSTTFRVTLPLAEEDPE